MPIHHSSQTDLDGNSWLVVNTQPNRERIAVEHLERQSYAVYCPFISRSVRHARKTQDVRRPLFPGYVFVALDPTVGRWRPIQSTVGVRSVVQFGEAPSFVDASFIACLKAREEAGVIARPASPYRVGQTVEIKRGSLEGLVSTIIEVGEQDRIILLLNLLGQQVRFRVGPEMISEISTYAQAARAAVSPQA